MVDSEGLEYDYRYGYGRHYGFACRSVSSLPYFSSITTNIYSAESVSVSIAQRKREGGQKGYRKLDGVFRLRNFVNLEFGEHEAKRMFRGEHTANYSNDRLKLGRALRDMLTLLTREVKLPLDKMKKLRVVGFQTGGKLKPL